MPPLCTHERHDHDVTWYLPQQHLLHIYCQKCARRKILALSFHFHPPCGTVRAVCHGLLKFCRASRTAYLLGERADGQIRAASSSFTPYLHTLPRPYPSFPTEGRRIQSRGVVTAFPRRNDPSFFPLTPFRHTQTCTQKRVHIPSRSFLLDSRLLLHYSSFAFLFSVWRSARVARCFACSGNYSSAVVNLHPHTHLHPTGTYDPCRVNTHAFRQSRCLTWEHSRRVFFSPQWLVLSKAACTSVSDLQWITNCKQRERKIYLSLLCYVKFLWIYWLTK